ncbi:DNA primase [Phyllobacterium myrsinacearum]|uniref:DNA primase n=1 Tax=Phyllobacterium myrsinacearum TaxID=28101 RepID=A0A2S9JX19_9HYPH|nr:DNA primase [Phyllobacterium myrsinacearum]PRD57856.1 DNA primase [Phyllobacterium myrsinacearum]PWV88645.1 DNA primase [Phyllobacterium myrsinacearum]RZV09990.1 DNA primase [Phyllobacterium myrsinacearum]
MRFPPSFLDEIRERVPISSVIGTRVSFDRKKTNAPKGDFWACCPFHGEKSPSFHCEDRKGRYHCFGCGVTGDHFKFLTELEGLSFPEAVQRVADMAGIPMPARDAEMEMREAKRATLYDVMDMATKFFEEQLQSAAGAKARAYLRDRGLSAATQHAYRLGYSPESRNALKEHLALKGATREQIEACGLVVYGDDKPVSYDRFRDRIMFPIEDLRGRVIAFGGRALTPNAPAKYLNSNETELFHKGKVLFNALRARRAAQPQAGQAAKAVIAVEGYMDVIALAQAGFGQAVAPLGTALTEDQLDLLWRMSPEPVLCFDGDQAGIKAAYRAIDLAMPALKPGRSLRFAVLPEGKDPDDLVKASGPQAFQAVLDDARPLADMLWARETSGGVFDTPERRAELESRLKQMTALIADENVRRHYAQDVRDRIQQFFGSNQRGGNNRRDGDQRGNGQNGFGGQNGYGQRGRGAASGRLAVSDSLARSVLVKTTSAAPPLRETAILMTLFNHPRLIEEDFETVVRLEFSHPDLKRFHSAMLNALAEHHVVDGLEMRKAMADAGHGTLIEALEALVRRARMWTATAEAAEEDALEALRQAVHLHQRASTLHKELKVAETALATETTDENLNRLLDIQNDIRNAQATEALIEGFGIPSGRSGKGF